MNVHFYNVVSSKPKYWIKFHLMLNYSKRTLTLNTVLRELCWSHNAITGSRHFWEKSRLPWSRGKHPWGTTENKTTTTSHLQKGVDLSFQIFLPPDIRCACIDWVLLWCRCAECESWPELMGLESEPLRWWWRIYNSTSDCSIRGPRKVFDDELSIISVIFCPIAC